MLSKCFSCNMVRSGVQNRLRKEARRICLSLLCGTRVKRIEMRNTQPWLSNKMWGRKIKNKSLIQSLNDVKRVYSQLIVVTTITCSCDCAFRAYQDPLTSGADFSSRKLSEVPSAAANSNSNVYRPIIKWQHVMSRT